MHNKSNMLKLVKDPFKLLLWGWLTPTGSNISSLPVYSRKMYGRNLFSWSLCLAVCSSLQTKAYKDMDDLVWHRGPDLNPMDQHHH